MKGVTLRKAASDDKDFIIDGTLEVCSIEREGPSATMKRSASRAVKEGRVIIASVAGKPAGFVQYVFTDKVPYGVGYGREDSMFCWVEWLYVSQGHRRAGIGTLLLKELSKVCRKSSIREMMLDVFKVNRNARSFYCAEGFDEIIGIMQKKV
ncbi:GNAT family N-acetyltransferase [Candidatus Woesearchaeota archaeon]|nr:GNAT family N-acetyltransferase [Candidatus Woesearchaeota archaeon]